MRIINFGPVCRIVGDLLIFSAMLKATFKAILFDLDGTLIHSAEDIRTAINLTLGEYGLEPIGYGDCVNFIGDGVEKLVQRSFGKLPGPIDDRFVTGAVTKFRQFYTAHLTDTTLPYPGVTETLAKLQKYNLAVISNKPHRFCLTILERLNLSDYFKFILGGDSLPTRKPDPGQILYIMKQLNLKASEVLVVGDSENDLLAARAIGAPAVAVTYGFRDAELLRKHQPDYTIGNFNELLELLGD